MNDQTHQEFIIEFSDSVVSMNVSKDELTLVNSILHDLIKEIALQIDKEK